MDKYIGRLLGGRYELIDVVGVGGMAMVYRARCHVLNRYVAVKILKDEYAKDPDIRKRFAIESQAVAKLSHHNIVSVYDVGNDSGTDYIVMELIEGLTLKEFLQKRGRLRWQEALFFAEQICRALMHAHSRGIIHQDIKPQNVIILRDGTAKLTDFGIASFATTQETRVVQEAIGSVHYISPEQAKGSQINYQTDIYSLGVVMYEMLTGRLPFEGETALQIVMQHLKAIPSLPSELQPGEIPAGFDEIVMHAMCANISRRYASAEELYVDLEHLKSDPDIRFHYTFLLDDASETQIIGKDLQQAARRAKMHSEHKRQAGQTPSRHQTGQRETQTPVRERETEPEGFFERLSERPGLAAAVAVSVVAVVALVVVGILLTTGGGKQGKVDKFPVPLFIGENIDEVLANEELTSQFALKEADTRKESTRPEGEIIEQSIGAEQEVEKGTSIVLTVSAGGENVKDTYKVVDFKDRTLDYVEAVLKEHNVSYRTSEEYSDEIEKGKVTRTDPVAGSELEKGATLTIYLSLGQETKETTVPELTGLTESAARKVLSDRKLSLGSVDQVESDVEAGIIVWQSAAKDKKVAEGTTVNVQVSKGKENAANPAQPATPSTPDSGTPGNTPDNNTPGDTPDEPDEPSNGSASVPVVLPPSTTTDSAHVVILVDGEIAYDNVLSTNTSGPVTIRVEGTAGNHEVTTTVDGQSSTSIYTFS